METPRIPKYPMEDENYIREQASRVRNMMKSELNLEMMRQMRNGNTHAIIQPYYDDLGNFAGEKSGESKTKDKTFIQKYWISLVVLIVSFITTGFLASWTIALIIPFSYYLYFNNEIFPDKDKKERKYTRS